VRAYEPAGALHDLAIGELHTGHGSALPRYVGDGTPLHADAALALDALAPDLETLAGDVDGLVDHGGDWFRKLTGAKHRATETARYVVDQAMRLAGGGGYGNGSELARLQRDVLAGIYHPSDTESVHSTVATNILGPLAE
jgi:alkylation response protein AidB-like acyl-CoA dehydrogenase